MKENNSKKVCRICVNESTDVKNISLDTVDCNGEQTSISNMLSAFNIKQEEELSDYPKSICANCLNQATAAHSFKLMCDRSKSLIEVYLKNVKLKEDSVSDTDDCNDPLDLLEVDYDDDDKSDDEDVDSTDSDSDSSESDETENKRSRKGRTKQKQNKNTSSPDTIYKCTQCEKSFTSKAVFYAHEKRHEQKGQFLCNVCGRGFNSKSCLTRHTRVHTGEKKYECNICHKKFAASNNLRLHSRTHSGQKPYLCTICGRNFGYWNVLMSHMRTHTNEKPYECEVCGKHFSRKGNMSQHMIIHTGWQNLKPLDKPIIKSDGNNSSNSESKNHANVEKN